MKKVLIVLLLLALAIRLLLVNLAYHGDMNNNISWGELALERGLINYYENDVWPYSAPNQPPLTILLFSSISWLWLSINKILWILNDNIGIFPSKLIWFWELNGKVFLFKLPSILADFGIAYIIFRWVKKITKNINKSYLSAFIWLFNPIVFYNSAIWGQTDSIVNFLGLASIYYLLGKNLTKSLLLFTFSLLFKGSLAFFIPIYLFVIILQRYDFKQIVKSTLTSVVIAVVICLPFHFHFDILLWLVNLYKDRIFPGEIGYLTANAFNFWWLVDSGKTYDSIKYLGISARVWGFAVTLFLMGIITRKNIRKFDQKNILLSFALISLVVFLFMTRIHERYIYPFFPYATILLFIFAKIKPVYLVLSIIFFLNMYNLFWFPPFGLLENTLKAGILPNILSFINLLSFLYILIAIKLRKV